MKYPAGSAIAVCAGAIAVGIAFGCRVEDRSAATAAAVEALMNADRAFAAESAAQGMDGWMDAFAPDGVRLVLGERAVQGRVSIREADAPLFADATRRLVWEPTDAGVFSDGRVGFTTGRSAFVRIENGLTSDTLSTGRYLTMWRVDQRGNWEVILDTGVSDRVD